MKSSVFPRTFLFFAIGICFPLAGTGEETEPSPQQLAFFEKKIRPVLAEKCYKCHSAESEKVKGGLLLDTRTGIGQGGDNGPSVVPGDVDSSLLIAAIRYEDDDMEMPPKERLPESVVKDFVRWVEMGAPDPREANAGEIAAARSEIDFAAGKSFWAFQRPEQPAVPKVDERDWPRNEIDHFVLAKLEAEKIPHAKDADRRILVRRVYFDLIGLPPTPDQVEAFVEDKAPGALARIVDELLSSPHFGERWGRHWLDVARYAESTGMERNNTFPHAWRYRDYVIDAFNRDLPYDQFLREQIAGDLLAKEGGPEDRDDKVIATAFLAMGPKSLNERNKEIFKMDIVDEQIEVTCRAALAITVNCARCHDHKFDPIAQEDYYAIAGILESSVTHFGTKGGGGNRQQSTLVAIGDAAEERKAALARYNKGLAEVNKRLGAAKKKLQVLQKKSKGKGAPPAELAALRNQVSATTKELAEFKKNRPEPPELAMGMGEGSKPADTALRIRGDVGSKGKLVPRGFLTVTKSDADPEIPKGESGRRQLAEWIVSPENPLTARVYVNRVWLHLFGQGIVRTVDNFGSQGELPSHPRLLDFLATRFMAEGWSTKSLIRNIVLSRTYQMASSYQSEANERDPENRLLWRMNPRRLDAESIRDAILMASGELEVDPAKGSLISEIGDGNIGRNAADLKKITDHQSPHRSVYLPIVRNALPELLQAFDFAEPSILVGRRDVTNVPTQALYLMNSEFVLDQAARITGRVLKSENVENSHAIGKLYEAVLLREPKPEESGKASRFLDGMIAGFAELPKEQQPKDPKRAAWESLSHAMLLSAEFRFLQ